MIEIATSELDAPGFLERVRRAVAGTRARARRPAGAEH
jgi:hypothetical protein